MSDLRPSLPAQDGGQTTSFWVATAPMPTPPALTADLETDVCVVGAGIAGMTTAYLLARQGRRVVVLDDGPIGGGETGRTTAHIANAIDDRYTELIRIHGEAGARLAAQSHSAALDLIERIVHDEAIACDFRRLDGYLFTPPGKSDRVLMQELKAAHQAGLMDVEMVARAPWAHFDTGPALRFPRQGQFHPLAYLQGLAQALERMGAHIFCDAHVDKVAGGDRVTVTTDRGRTVTAQAAVVATNSPINDYVVTHLKQAPYRTYAIAAPIPPGEVAVGLYWDTLDPYHYVRLQSDPDRGDLLIIGGEDHKTGQADHLAGRWDRLEQWARERFPTLGAVTHRWSGQVLETIDGLAYIGRTPDHAPNVYIATGDSGMGMTHGTIAGILLTALIVDGNHPWAKLYDPLRLPLSTGALTELAKEGLNAAFQYKDLITPGDASTVEEIAPGTGAVLRRGLDKVAVYRDAQGQVHSCSAICTHMACVVDWNDMEKSWDCPCHGSRFDPYGKVLNGPASADLALVEAAKVR